MNKILKNNLVLGLKGLGMGAANVIPGVSGGTIAFITGIYERLVGAINSINTETLKLLLHGKFKKVWKLIDGQFLMWLLGGVAVATFSLAKLMLVCLENWPVQTWAFFFGLIIASSIVLLAGSDFGKGWGARIGSAAWLAVGGALGVAVCTMGSLSNSPDSLWFVFLCGAVSICAMILPGLSGSYILMLMGKYEYIMDSITGVLKLDWNSIAVVAVFGLGAVCGLLAFAKLLHFLLERWNRQTLMLLCGFVLGSLVGVWPWRQTEALAKAGLPTEGFPCLWGAITFCAIGIVMVLMLELAGKSSGKKEKAE